MFGIRIVTVDHYMNPPIPGLDPVYSEFRGSEVKHVPVIRIFGATAAGQKTCLHVHGVFPYICVPYEGTEPHARVVYQLATSLDKALNISLGNANSPTQHVYKIKLVSGIPFYGYHEREHQFFKIYFYNPLLVKKAVDLLQNGAILNKIYQPHDAHVPFILQFFIDYNLYGMSFVNLDHVKFRRRSCTLEMERLSGSSGKTAQEISVTPERSTWNVDAIPNALLLPETVERMSTCELEVDGVAADIINRREISADVGVNPGLKAIWDDEKQRRRELDKSSQITLQTSQERPVYLGTKSELFYKERLLQRILSSNSQVQRASSVCDSPVVYPAETPEDSGLLEASYLDVHVPSAGSGGSSSNQLTSRIASQDALSQKDDSIVNEDIVLSLQSASQTLSSQSVLFNSQDVKLVDILGELEDEGIDDDSILGTQVPKIDEEEEDGQIEDMSQPFNKSLDVAEEMEEGDCKIGSTKVSESSFCESEHGAIWPEDSFWEEIDEKIPQLDGVNDVPEKPVRRRLGMTGRANQRTEGHSKTKEQASIQSCSFSNAASYQASDDTRPSDGVNYNNRSSELNEQVSTVTYNNVPLDVTEEPSVTWPESDFLSDVNMLSSGMNEFSMDQSLHYDDDLEKMHNVVDTFVECYEGNETIQNCSVDRSCCSLDKVSGDLLQDVLIGDPSFTALRSTDKDDFAVQQENTTNFHWSNITSLVVPERQLADSGDANVFRGSAHYINESNLPDIVSDFLSQIEQDSPHSVSVKSAGERLSSERELHEENRFSNETSLNVEDSLLAQNNTSESHAETVDSFRDCLLRTEPSNISELPQSSGDSSDVQGRNGNPYNKTVSVENDTLSNSVCKSGSSVGCDETKKLEPSSVLISMHDPMVSSVSDSGIDVSVENDMENLESIVNKCVIDDQTENCNRVINTLSPISDESDSEELGLQRRSDFQLAGIAAQHEDSGVANLSVVNSFCDSDLIEKVQTETGANNKENIFFLNVNSECKGIGVEPEKNIRAKCNAELARNVTRIYNMREREKPVHENNTTNKDDMCQSRKEMRRLRREKHKKLSLSHRRQHSINLQEDSHNGESSERQQEIKDQAVNIDVVNSINEIITIKREKPEQIPNEVIQEKKQDSDDSSLMKEKCKSTEDDPDLFLPNDHHLCPRNFHHETVSIAKREGVNVITDMCDAFSPFKHMRRDTRSSSKLSSSRKVKFKTRRRDTISSSGGSGKKNKLIVKFDFTPEKARELPREEKRWLSDDGGEIAESVKSRSDCFSEHSKKYLEINAKIFDVSEHEMDQSVSDVNININTSDNIKQLHMVSPTSALRKVRRLSMKSLSDEEVVNVDSDIKTESIYEEQKDVAVESLSFEPRPREHTRLQHEECTVKNCEVRLEKLELEGLHRVCREYNLKFLVERESGNANMQLKDQSVEVSVHDASYQCNSASESSHVVLEANNNEMEHGDNHEMIRTMKKSLNTLNVSNRIMSLMKVQDEFLPKVESNESDPVIKKSKVRQSLTLCDVGEHKRVKRRRTKSHKSMLSISSLKERSQNYERNIFPTCTNAKRKHIKVEFESNEGSSSDDDNVTLASLMNKDLIGNLVKRRNSNLSSSGSDKKFPTPSSVGDTTAVSESKKVLTESASLCNSARDSSMLQKKESVIGSNISCSVVLKDIQKMILSDDRLKQDLMHYSKCNITRNIQSQNKIKYGSNNVCTNGAPVPDLKMYQSEHADMICINNNLTHNSDNSVRCEENKYVNEVVTTELQHRESILTSSSVAVASEITELLKPVKIVIDRLPHETLVKSTAGPQQLESVVSKEESSKASISSVNSLEKIRENSKCKLYSLDGSLDLSSSDDSRESTQQPSANEAGHLSSVELRKQDILKSSRLDSEANKANIKSEGNIQASCKCSSFKEEKKSARSPNKSPIKNRKRSSNSVHSERSPKKSMYTPLQIIVQKSPKKLANKNVPKSCDSGPKQRVTLTTQDTQHVENSQNDVEKSTKAKCCTAEYQKAETKDATSVTTRSYSDGTYDDFSVDYKDALSNMAYLTPGSNCNVADSPPQAGSPGIPEQQTGGAKQDLSGDECAETENPCKSTSCVTEDFIDKPELLSQNRSQETFAENSSDTSQSSDSSDFIVSPPEMNSSNKFSFQILSSIPQLRNYRGEQKAGEGSEVLNIKTCCEVKERLSKSLNNVCISKKGARKKLQYPDVRNQTCDDDDRQDNLISLPARILKAEGVSSSTSVSMPKCVNARRRCSDDLFSVSGQSTPVNDDLDVIGKVIEHQLGSNCQNEILAGDVIGKGGIVPSHDASHDNESDGDSDVKSSPLNKSDDTQCSVGITSFYETSFLLTNKECNETIEFRDQNTPLQEKTIMLASSSKQQSNSPQSFLTTTTSGVKKTFVPVKKPPHPQEVSVMLDEYNLPEFKHQTAYYSNIADVADKAKEIGGHLLKLCSNSVVELPPFEGNFQSRGIDHWQKMLLHNSAFASQRNSTDYDKCGNLKCALASNRYVVIAPVKLAPSLSEAENWLKARKSSNTNTIQDNDCNKHCRNDTTVIPRYRIPSSPSALVGDSDDDDGSIVLSPCTPENLSMKSTTLPLGIPAKHSTPQVDCIQASRYRSNSPLCTPIVEKLTDPKPLFSVGKLLRQRRRSWENRLKERRGSRHSVELNDSTLEPIAEEDEAKDVNKEETVNDLPEEYQGAGIDRPLEKIDAALSQDNGEADKITVSSSGVQPNSEEGPCESPHPSLSRSDASTPLLRRRSSSSCQIEGNSPNNTFGFCVSYDNLQDVKAVVEHQHLTLMVLELHVTTRGELRPDPEHDAIAAVFYTINNDYPLGGKMPREETGAIVVDPTLSSTSENSQFLTKSAVDCKVKYVSDELLLLQEVVSLVQVWDPDILAGYEIEMQSWGYFLHRAYQLNQNFCPLLSRIPKAKNDSHYVETSEQDVVPDFLSELRLAGRIVLNVWRLMRHEVALQSYTFENIMYHVLHQRLPLYSYKSLTQFWNHRTCLYRWKVVEHYIQRVQGITKMLEQLDLIGRTSELARLFGIQFYEVLSRGSQFRVESMMLRLTRPLNYIPVSPSIKQRARMRAPEYIPLIMEPESRYYADPVIVLDFQSLYPSIIIGYNYCFSTCLGRVEYLGKRGPFEFGCTQLKVPSSIACKVKNMNISPCGVAFVKADIRKGVLPRMLEEILETRLMVKKAMKEYKSDKTLQRVLHSRQLGLKLIANVTYGYTAANFSGRMPCSEVGDSVVSKSRETLERAIQLVERTERWKARVVYGDTDSLFVLVPGRSREQAFAIGEEIVEAVTNDNPKPVKLKLEKVYQPCILQTKKRYVGYMYESPNQETPVYDAKGIETVRRDGCPAVAKMLEKSLRILFETQDVSLVKRYVQRQFQKLIQGRINIQDLIFAREFRGLSGYRPGACVPALELTRQWLKTDRRAEPRLKERVPYIIISGPPGLPLIRLVRSPHDLLTDPSLKVNSLYYISRVITPPLNRCFSLLGADVDSWYSDMPKILRTYLPSVVPAGQKKSTISQYFSTMNCVVCESLTNHGLCSSCQEDPQKVIVNLDEKVRLWERRYKEITKICQSCCKNQDPVECISLDCPVLFRRNLARRDLNQADFIYQLRERFLF